MSLRNSLLRLSANGIILIDGKLPGNYRAFMSQVRSISKISDLPVRFLVVTDHHEEHTGNNSQFVEAGVRIIGHKNVQRHLAAMGRTQMHRSLGTIGIAYGFLVLAMGLAVSIAAPVMHFKNGEQPLDEAAGFLIIPLGDMVLFAGFFIPAVIYRNRPELHKRFMLLATTALLFAAAGRMSSAISLPLAVVVWLMPVFAGMA